jgi:hypothetical protein
MTRYHHVDFVAPLVIYLAACSHTRAQLGLEWATRTRTRQQFGAILPAVRPEVTFCQSLEDSWPPRVKCLPPCATVGMLY